MGYPDFWKPMRQVGGTNDDLLEWSLNGFQLALCLQILRPTLFQENPHLHTFARFVGSSLVIWFIWGNVVIEIMNPAFLFYFGDMGSYNARMNLKHLGFSLRFVTLLVEPFNPSRLEEPSRLFFCWQTRIFSGWLYLGKSCWKEWKWPVFILEHITRTGNT